MKETKNPKVLLGGVVRKIYRQTDRNQAFFMKKKELQIDHADLTKAVAEQN